MPGQLFTHHFLTHGITETPEWRSSDAAAVNFQGGLIEIFESFQGYRQPNEAVTEQELIRPVLELLGWADYLPQQGAARNEDIPDLLLFPDAGSKGGPPREAAPKRDTAMRSWWRRASASACPWTPGTRMGAAPGRPTARCSGTCRPPISSPRAGSGGGF